MAHEAAGHEYAPRSICRILSAQVSCSSPASLPPVARRGWATIVSKIPNTTKVLANLTGWQKRVWLDGGRDIAAGQFSTRFSREANVFDEFDDLRAREWLVIDEHAERLGEPRKAGGRYDAVQASRSGMSVGVTRADQGVEREARPLVCVPILRAQSVERSGARTDFPTSAASEVSLCAHAVRLGCPETQFQSLSERRRFLASCEGRHLLTASVPPRKSG